MEGSWVQGFFSIQLPKPASLECYSGLYSHLPTLMVSPKIWTYSSMPYDTFPYIPMYIGAYSTYTKGCSKLAWPISLMMKIAANLTDFEKVIKAL